MFTKNPHCITLDCFRNVRTVCVSPNYYYVVMPPQFRLRHTLSAIHTLCILDHRWGINSASVSVTKLLEDPRISLQNVRRLELGNNVWKIELLIDALHVMPNLQFLDILYLSILVTNHGILYTIWETLIESSITGLAISNRVNMCPGIGSSVFCQHVVDVLRNRLETLQFRQWRGEIDFGSVSYPKLINLNRVPAFMP